MADVFRSTSLSPYKFHIHKVVDGKPLSQMLTVHVLARASFHYTLGIRGCGGISISLSVSVYTTCGFGRQVDEADHQSSCTTK